MPNAMSAWSPGLQLFALVVLLAASAGGVLWLLRRLQLKGAWPGATRRIQMLESRALGPRHRLVLVRVGDREWLLGVSPSEIRSIGGWAVGEGGVHEAAAPAHGPVPGLGRQP
jgi:flagellar biosynthetic protein FliO